LCVLVVPSSQDRISLQDEKINEFIEQIRSLEETSSRQQAEFLSEVSAQKRLADLYKSHLDEAVSKVEQLEEANATWKENFAKQANTYKAKLSEQIEKSGKVIAKTEEDCKAQLLALQAELDAVKANGTPGASTSSVTVVPQEFEELGITEMYDRVVRAEKELVAEQVRRGELELYLDRILKDVQSKAPLIASQRKDYMRVLESHSQLTAKLDRIVTENTGLKQKLEGMERSRKEAVDEAAGLEMQNKDLGRQIQHLLRQQMGVPHSSAGAGSTGNADGVISEYLVDFGDIEELQTRNMQLLKVVRKLSMEQEEALGGHGGNGAVAVIEDGSKVELQEALASSMSELKQMRESRVRMEEMVGSLVQQRDIYRAMLEEVDGGSARTAGSSALTVPLTPTSPKVSSASAMSASKASEEMRMKLAEVSPLCNAYHVVIILFD
jgi:nucleoprotein TPR